MGYYIQTTESQIHVSAKNFQDAYRAMCSLNNNDNIKRGGRWGGDGIDRNEPRPEGATFHPARWFSWMPADFPNVCKTFQEVMESLGFHCTYNEESGDLVHLTYDNKRGQEELFLNAIAPYVAKGSYIAFRGEDDNEWRLFFDGVGMTTQNATKVWWS